MYNSYVGYFILEKGFKQRQNNLILFCLNHGGLIVIFIVANALLISTYKLFNYVTEETEEI